MLRFSFVEDIIKQRKELKDRDWLGTIDEGKEHFLDIERYVQATKATDTILFDIDRLKLFGYSYAKQTIRRALQSAVQGDYDSRFFLVHAPNKKFCAELERALMEESLMMIASSRSGSDFYDDYFLLGTVNPQVEDTLRIVLDTGEVKTNEIAKKLNVSLQVASNRLKDLSNRRLVMRDKPTDRYGNIYLYRRIKIS